MFAVKTVKRTSTGTVFSGPARVLSIHAIAGGSAGSIVIKDGGASGTTLIDLDTPASSTEGIVNPSFTDEEDNPGSKLKTAVTGKVKPGSKAAKRRKSFCARSAGQMKKFPKAAKDPNSRLRQARKRWRC
jgi:hypothetical protein